MDRINSDISLDSFIFESEHCEANENTARSSDIGINLKIRPQDGRAGIKSICNKENLPESNVQPALANTCENSTKHLSNNVIDKLLGGDFRQKKLLQVAENKREVSQAPQPELAGDQNFINSINPEYSNPVSNDGRTSDMTKHVTSTPKANPPVGFNRDETYMSPIFASSTSTRATDADTSVINIASLSNITERDSEETIMGFVDVLIASEEDDIRQEVEERFGRMLENRRAAFDSLMTSITVAPVTYEEEMEMDSSVEIVSAMPGSLHPIVNLVDSTDVIVLSNNDSDIEICEEPCTSVGARVTRRRKAAAPNQCPIKKRKITRLPNPVEILPNKACEELATATPAAAPQNFAPSTYDCPICLNELKSSDISATTCGHVFCTPCIRAAVKSLKNCPNCRTKLTLKKIHPLFL